MKKPVVKLNPQEADGVTRRGRGTRGMKFKVGETVNLPIVIEKIDRRFNPPMYYVSSKVSGWSLDDKLSEGEMEKRHVEAQP